MKLVSRRSLIYDEFMVIYVVLNLLFNTLLTIGKYIASMESNYVMIPCIYHIYVLWCKVHENAHIVIIVKSSFIWAIGIKSSHVCNPIILGDWCKNRIIESLVIVNIICIYGQLCIWFIKPCIYISLEHLVYDQGEHGHYDKLLSYLTIVPLGLYH